MSLMEIACSDSGGFLMNSRTCIRMSLIPLCEVWEKCQRTLSLAHILDSADLAGDAVYEVRISTANVFHGRENLVSVVGTDRP